MFKFKELSISGSLRPVILLVLVLGGAKALEYGASDGYVNTGVTIIEDKTDGGVLIFSNHFNYVIQSPQLAKLNWAAVSINGEEVSIILLNKLTLTTTLETLNTPTQDVIRLVKSFYLKNICGLSLSYSKITKNLIGQVSKNSYQNYGGQTGTAGNPSQSYGSVGNASVASYGNGGYNYGASISQTFNGNSIFELINPIGSPLRKALAGNVYLFDLIGNIFNVYSSTVSVQSSATVSIVYVNQDFFSYSAPNMVSNINRIFLKKLYLFIVYNDGSILVKLVSTLKSVESNLLKQARLAIQLLDQEEKRAALAIKQLGALQASVASLGSVIGNLSLSGGHSVTSKLAAVASLVQNFNTSLDQILNVILKLAQDPDKSLLPELSALANLEQDLDKLFKFLLTAITKLAQDPDKLLAPELSAIESLVQDVNKLLKLILTAIGKIGQDPDKSLAPELGTLVNEVQGLQKAFKLLLNAVTMLVQDPPATESGSLANQVQGLNKLLKLLLNIIAMLVQNLKQSLAADLNAIGDLVADLDKLPELLLAAIGKLTQDPDKFLAPELSAIEKLSVGLNKLLKLLLTAVGKLAHDLENSLEPELSALANRVLGTKKLFELLISALPDAVRHLDKALTAESGALGTTDRLGKSPAHESDKSLTPDTNALEKMLLDLVEMISLVSNAAAKMARDPVE